ncbi:unnamed protein product, partial [Meganyctiphanes norvegica]
MSKRPLDEGGSTSAPAPKKVQFDPVQLGSISTLEEMDMKTLRFQNHKLVQRLEQRKRAEEELKGRIEQLEKRQTQSDDVLTVINRYWNQFNEDIRLMLQRYDAETADESETKNESEATTSFLTQLSTWDREELDEKLVNRVQVSKRAVAKIVQAFDRLHQRNEKVSRALKGEAQEGENPPELEESVRDLNTGLQQENKNLQSQNLTLHEKHHVMSLKVKELEEKLAAMETEKAECQNRLEDMEYDLNKTRNRCEKIEAHLADTCQKLKDFQDGIVVPVQSTGNNSKQGGNNSNNTGNKVPTQLTSKKLDELNSELEEHKELCAKRLDELEKKTNEHKEALKEVEKLKMDLRQLPESIIVETTEYKCLQSQFSVLYNESMQLKTQLEETRHQLQTSKNTHLRQIEQMESEELTSQKKLRTEVIQLEDMLAQVRKEYEMLRIEFEQNLAANEQTGPINREMRHLITSLQNHISQLKGEIHRYKRKYKEAALEANKLKREVEELTQKLAARQRSASVGERQDSVSSDRGEGMKEQVVKEEGSESCDSSGPPTSMAQAGNTPGGTSAGVGNEDKTPENSDVKKEEGDEDTKGNEDGDKKDDKTKKDVKKEGKVEVKNEGKAAGAAAQAAKDARESEIIRALKADMKRMNELNPLKILYQNIRRLVTKNQKTKIEFFKEGDRENKEGGDAAIYIKDEYDAEKIAGLSNEKVKGKEKEIEKRIQQMETEIINHREQDRKLKENVDWMEYRMDEEQYRPVSLTSRIMKVFERVLKVNIMEHLNYCDVYEALAEGIRIDTVYLDFAKAFDKVNHNDTRNSIKIKTEADKKALQTDLESPGRIHVRHGTSLRIHRTHTIAAPQFAADCRPIYDRLRICGTSSEEVRMSRSKRVEFEFGRPIRGLRGRRKKMVFHKKFSEIAQILLETLIEEISENANQQFCLLCQSSRNFIAKIKC